MIFHVYILYSKLHDKFYIRQSKDVYQRILLHNKGDVKSTAPYLPWKVLWYCKRIHVVRQLFLNENSKTSTVNDS
ncbi:MAG: GIY-YIG nuclease family protein [Crocinitomicaceae bacterium]|nr:GIY-YIG nuclease family protein [Crocinitomicaceae bacterium]